ncbi:urea carboxylase, partial [Pseudomonas sp. MWU13-2625]
MPIIESRLDPRDAIHDTTLNAGEPWLRDLKRGQVLRILDLEGNQAVDTLFYRSDDPEERYSAQDTIRAQRNLYLSAGSVLLSSRGNPM